MNFSTIFGMGTAIALILIAAVLTTQRPELLWDPLSLVIVLGGTIAAEANVFRAMASFAPALGMVGTLLGLVNMLTEIGGDMMMIGYNLAVALMTTLYGVVAANLFFRPIAIKLEHRTQQRVELMNLVLEGVLLVQQRRSPGMLRETMKAYTTEHKDELGAGRKR